MLVTFRGGGGRNEGIYPGCFVIVSVLADLIWGEGSGKGQEDGEERGVCGGGLFIYCLYRPGGVSSTVGASSIQCSRLGRLIYPYSRLNIGIEGKLGLFSRSSGLCLFASLSLLITCHCSTSPLHTIFSGTHYSDHHHPN